MAEDFVGLYTDADAADIVDGATQVQDNIQSFIPGLLRVRRGMSRANSLINANGTFGVDDLITIYKYPYANGDFVITADIAGEVKSRRDNIINSIATGRFKSALWSFSRDRRGSLVGINGRERGFYWNGETAAIDLLGIDPPTAGPTLVEDTLSAGGELSAGEYICYYRYLAEPIENSIYSNMSPGTAITVGANTYIAWSDILPSSQSRVLGVQLWRSLPGDTNTLYLVGEAGTTRNVVDLSDANPDMRVQFDLRHGFQVGQVITIAGAAGAGDNGNWEVTAIVNDVTVDVGPKIWSGVPVGPSATASATGTSKDGTSDQDLIDLGIADNRRVTVFVDASGQPVASRFVPPPVFKHDLAKFQDRMFYAGDVADATGEISTTAGSTTVTFTNPGIPGNAVGQVLWLPLSTGTESFKIESIDTTTTISVYPAVPETLTTSLYSLRPPESERNVVYYSEPDEPESVPLVNSVIVQEQSQDEDEIVGVKSFGTYLYILKQRHIYTFSFARQPRIDGQARLLTHRGALNKNCWSVYEGSAYVMDQSGAYILELNGNFQEISGPIQDLFRDGIIDFSKSKWFFVSVDYNAKLVRFHVSMVNDTGPRPYRALVFSIRQQRWWTESYPFALAGSAMVIIDDVPQLLVGGQADMVVSFDAQESDIVTQEIRGIVTSATLTQLVDSSANFSLDVVGAPVGITTGDGRCQVRTIIDRPNPNTLEIGNPTGSNQLFDQAGQPFFFQDGQPWEVQAAGSGSPGFIGSSFEPVPAPGDGYMVGAILWQMLSKQYALEDKRERVHHFCEIDFLPTESNYEIDISKFYDHLSAPDRNYMSMVFGTGVVTTEGRTYETLHTSRVVDDYGERIGENRVHLVEKLDQRLQGRRRVAFNFKGLKGDERIEITELDFVKEM